MVAGKLLTLVFIGNACAGEVEEPHFFEYKSNAFTNRLSTLTFGWFKTLDKDQNDAYYQSLTHAVMYAENGQAVRWYMNNAGGISVPVMTWPTSMGYCRRIHIQTRAYNLDKTMAATACYDNTSDNWTWYTDKY